MSASNGTSGTSSLVVSSSIPSSLPASSAIPAESSAASSAAPAETSSAVPTSSAAEPSSEPTSSAAVSTPAPSSSVNPPSSADPTTAAPASSSPVSLPPSSSEAPASTSAPPASSTPPPSSEPPATTITSTAPRPSPSTDVITSVVTPTNTVPGQSQEPSTIIRTIVTTPSADPNQNSDPAASTPSATGTTPAGLQGVDQKGTSSGLSAGGKTAIAVVVPVVVVAALVIAGILFWRRRKQKKNAEEARRKEVEEYGFNPNNDPTLPAVGMGSEMAEDQSGYRGWGNTSSSNRKASTTLTSGMTYSDSNSNPGGYQSPGSPTHGTHSDAQSNDPLMNGRRETLDSEGIGALGAAPNAQQNQTGVNRGPSNASSSYSAAGRSDNSGDYPIPINNPADDYGYNGNYQPYSYNDGYGGGQQPVIRDVSARRNTRIENPSVFPQQGNSGIAQNF